MKDRLNSYQLYKARILDWTRHHAPGACRLRTDKGLSAHELQLDFACGDV